MYGFLNGCLPAVCLGRIKLKSKYLSALVSVTSFDSDGAMLPIAFGVVDLEDDENWKWFLSALHRAFAMNTSNMLKLTFIPDGQKGVVDAISGKFPGSSHAFCMCYLTGSLAESSKTLVHLPWEAAYATTTVNLKEKMNKFAEASPEAYKQVLRLAPFFWALNYFEGMRYGHLSSNTKEFMNGFLKPENCALPS